MSLVLATRNDHKVREFERLLPGVTIEPLPDSAPTPEETGTTYAENALIKARSAAEAHRQAGVRGRLGHRGRGTRLAPWRPHRPLRRSRRERRREPRPSSTARRRRAAARATLRDRVRDAGRRGAALRGPCEGRWRSSRRAGRLRLRPAVHPVELPGPTMAELTRRSRRTRISHRGKAARDAGSHGSRAEPGRRARAGPGRCAAVGDGLDQDRPDRWRAPRAESAGVDGRARRDPQPGGALGRGRVGEHTFGRRVKRSRVAEGAVARTSRPVAGRARSWAGQRLRRGRGAGPRRLGSDRTSRSSRRRHPDGPRTGDVWPL